MKNANPWNSDEIANGFTGPVTSTPATGFPAPSTTVPVIQAPSSSHASRWSWPPPASASRPGRSSTWKCGWMSLRVNLRPGSRPSTSKVPSAFETPSPP